MQEGWVPGEEPLRRKLGPAGSSLGEAFFTTPHAALELKPIKKTKMCQAHHLRDCIGPSLLRKASYPFYGCEN